MDPLGLKWLTPITRVDYSSMLRGGFQGGTADFPLWDIRPPVFQCGQRSISVGLYEISYSCCCVKDETGIANVQGRIFLTHSTLPPGLRQDSFWKDRIAEFARLSNWHETTEMMLLGRLYAHTLAIAESRAQEFTCSKGRYMPLYFLYNYIKWDKSYHLFMAQMRYQLVPGGRFYGDTAFDDKFGYSGLGLANDPTKFRIEDFDEWYAPELYD